jgi:uncharacterized membrane protein YeaQ/YmgE (transglycosylase-associated protein family)
VWHENERSEGRDVGILSWLIVGAFVGLLANRLMAGSFPGGLFGTVVGGTLGAVLGGLVFSLIMGRGVTGFDGIGLLIAVAGAALLVTVLGKAGGVEPRAH